MSSPRRPRPVTARPLASRSAALLLAGVLPLALAGCGAGRDAQTYQERSQADATNTAVGTLAIRGLAVLPSEDGRTLEEGEDAEAVLVVTNNDDEPDTLLEVTTDGAESVEVLVEDSPASLEVPALGSTENTARLRLVSLTQDLTEGEYVTMTFRFEKNGTIEVPVPVAVSGRTDRPVYTGGEGEEGEPALQAPAGGHHGEESGGDEDGAGGEGEEGIVGEGESGQGEDEGETAPRSEESPEGEGAEEPAESAEPEASASPSTG